ncbi:MAG: CARDB domain-containing protein [Thermoplasmatota archaeon]
MIDSDMNTYSPYYGQKWAKLSPGAEAIYWIIIYNMGPLNDTFHVELSAPPRDAGWNWYFMDIGKLFLEVDLISPQVRDEIGGITYKTFPIMVQCPIDATRDPRIPMTVTAVSERDLFDPGIVAPVDSDELLIITGNVGYLPIRLWDQTLFLVEPGEWITLPVSVTNLGNKDAFNVTLTIDESEYWRSSYRDFESIYQRKGYILDYEWTETTVTVWQGQTVRLDVRVRVPPEIFGSDDVMQFRMFGRIEGSNYWMTSDVVTLIVERYAELKVAIFEGESFPVEPGKVERVHLNVFNTFENQDVLEDVLLLDPKGVRLEVFNETNSSFENMGIRGFSTAIVPLEFYVDDHYPFGLLDLKLVIRTRYYGKIFLNVTLDVRKKAGIKLLPTDPLISDVIDMSPGKEKTLVFGVRNEGNCDAKVTLELVRDYLVESMAYPIVLDSGWFYYVDWLSQVREPSNFMSLKPDDIPVRTEEFYKDIGYTFPQQLNGYDLPFYIEPGETVWVGLGVICPGGLGGELIPPYPVTAMVFSEFGEVLDRFDTVLEPKYPDLIFEDLMVLTNDKGDQVMDLNEGDKVFFLVNVSNIGQGFSDRVKVSVRVNDDLVKDLWIIPLPPGEKTLLYGNITISYGMKKIELVLDPENNVPELDDQFMVGSTPDANIIRAPLYVEGEKDGNGGLFFALMIVLIVLLLLSTFGVLTLYFWIRKVRSLKQEGR